MELNRDVLGMIFSYLPLTQFYGCNTLYRVSRGLNNLLKDEYFWKCYTQRHYLIESVHYLPGYNGKEMAKLCQTILDRCFKQGSLLKVESLRDILSEHFINLVINKGLLRGVFPTESRISQRIVAYIFDDCGVDNNSFIFLNQGLFKRIKFPWEVQESVQTISLSGNKNERFIYLMKNLIQRPTQYFTPSGIITVPFDIEFDVYDFFDINDRTVPILTGRVDRRDDLTLGAECYGQLIFKWIHQRYLHQQLQLVPKDGNGASEYKGELQYKFVKILSNPNVKYLEDLGKIEISLDSD